MKKSVSFNTLCFSMVFINAIIWVIITMRIFDSYTNALLAICIPFLSTIVSLTFAISNMKEIDKEARGAWYLVFIGTTAIFSSIMCWRIQITVKNLELTSSLLNNIFGNAQLLNMVLVIVTLTGFIMAFIGTHNIYNKKGSTSFKLSRFLELIGFTVALCVIITRIIAITHYAYPKTDFLLDILFNGNFVNLVTLGDSFMLWYIAYLSTSGKSRGLPLSGVILGTISLLIALIADILLVSETWMKSGVSHNIGSPADTLRAIGFILILFSQTAAIAFKNKPANLVMNDLFVACVKAVFPYSAVMLGFLMCYVMPNDSAKSVILLTVDLMILLIISVIRGGLIIRENAKLEYEKWIESTKKEILNQENIRLNQELQEKLEEQAEQLDKAWNTHRKVLPKNNTLNLECLQVSGINIPVKEVGGDYFDFFQLDDKRVLVVLCDVMGKGLPAALLTLLIRGIIKYKLKSFTTTSILLNKINESLFDDLNKMESYITMVALTYDANNGMLTYSSAGHNPGVMIKRSNNDVQILKTKGTAIGLKKDIQYQEQTKELNGGDIICLYSDGITDTKNDKNELYGVNRLVAAIKTNINKSVDDVKNEVIQDVKNFAEEKAQRDDRTLVVLKIAG